MADEPLTEVEILRYRNGELHRRVHKLTVRVVDLESRLEQQTRAIESERIHESVRTDSEDPSTWGPSAGEEREAARLGSDDPEMFRWEGDP